MHVYVCICVWLCVYDSGILFQFYSGVIDIQPCIRLRYTAGKYFYYPKKELLHFMYISTFKFTLKNAIKNSFVHAVPSSGIF